MFYGCAVILLRRFWVLSVVFGLFLTACSSGSAAPPTVADRPHPTKQGSVAESSSSSTTSSSGTNLGGSGANDFFGDSSSGSSNGSSSSSAPLATGGQWVKSTDGLFSIVVPFAWRAEKVTGTAILGLVQASTGALVVAVRVPGKASQVPQLLANARKDSSYLGPIESMDFDGVSANGVKKIDPNDSGRVQYVYYVPHAGDAMLMALSVPRANAEDVFPIFRIAVTSFMWAN